MKWEATPLNVAASFGDNADPNLLIASLIAFVVTFFIVVALAVAHICATCEIFRKAGQDKCWKGIIPIYRTYLLCKLVWNTKVFVVVIVSIIAAVIAYCIGIFAPTAFIAFGIVLIAQIIIYALITFKLCKAFGHSIGWTLGIIFLEPIFWLMLAFGKSSYVLKK